MTDLELTFTMLGEASTAPSPAAARTVLDDYLPLADEWALWDNQTPPPVQVADSGTHRIDELPAMLQPTKIQESPPREMSEMSKIVLEAGRVATEKMLDHYKRMGIKVTPQMTLASDQPERDRRNAG